MDSTSVRISSVSFLVSAAVLSAGLLLSGCGGASNNTAGNTPPLTPTASQPGPGGTGGSSASSGSASNGGGSSSGGSSSGSGSGGGSGNGGNSSSSISGTVVNGLTGAPVTGKVVVGLESGFGDPQIVGTTTADAQGHFQFITANPSENGWMLAVSASSADGSLFAVSYLFSAGPPINGNSQGDQIVAGTNVGTISVFPSASTTLTGTVTSQDSAGASQDVNVAVNPLRTFTFDRDVQVPWLNVPAQVATSASNSGCSGQGSCASYQLQVPSGNVQWAVYNHNGNHFQPFTAPNHYSVLLFALSQSTGDNDCNPSSQEASQQGSSFSEAHFVNCAP